MLLNLKLVIGIPEIITAVSKHMVLEGSTAIWGVVELSNTIATHSETNIPKNLYLITDGSRDRKVINLSVQTALTAYS